MIVMIGNILCFFFGSVTSLLREAVALALGQGALGLCFEPVSDVRGMATVLAGLAPQQPHVNPVIQILLLRAAVQLSLSLVDNVNGVEHGD